MILLELIMGESLLSRYPKLNNLLETDESDSLAGVFLTILFSWRSLFNCYNRRRWKSRRRKINLFSGFYIPNLQSN